MKNPNALMTSLVLLACFALAPRGAEAAYTAALLRELAALGAAMQETQRVVGPMDIATLAVQDEEGKLWERNRQRVMHWTSLIEDQLEHVRHSEDLVGAFLLFTSLDSLLSSLESLSTQLGNPIFRGPMTNNRQKWRERASQWALDIKFHMLLLSGTRRNFHAQVMTIMDHADARLKACR